MKSKIVVYDIVLYGRRFFSILIYVFVILLSADLFANDSYQFDPDILLGNGDKININEINQSNYIEPGDYDLDIFVNNVFIYRNKIKIESENKDQNVPCFSQKQLEDMGIITKTDFSSCKKITEIIPKAKVNFDATNFSLRLTIPQIDLKNKPRGYVPESDLDSGDSMLFVNYTGNYYKNKSNGSTSDYGFASFNAGFNLGVWQVRQQASYSYNSNSNSSNSTFNWIRTYIQRPILFLKSQFVAGDIYTSGSLFSSLSFKGAQLMSDDRMLPDSQQGYAPVIRGIATTSANVVVKQNGTQIYQTTVSPGQFEINDLYPTSYEGDLLVEIHEADGKTSSFTVPFSAVPESVRPGHMRYNVSAGKINNFSTQNSHFVDLSIKRGITNLLSLSSGLRIGDKYQALALGTTLATNFGAFGINSAISNTEINGEKLQGYRLGINYSQTLAPTNTIISLLGYKYSTENFRELNDVLGLRQSHNNGLFWNSATYKQESQITLNINQPLGDWGNIYASGSLNHYYGNKSKDIQYQLGYSKTFKDISFNVAYSHQKSGKVSDNNSFTSNDYSPRSEDVIMLSASVPLGKSEYAPMLMLNSNHNRDNSSYQTTISGLLGEDKTLNYSVSESYDTQNKSVATDIHLGKQSAYGSVTTSLSHGKDYKQGSLGIQGAIVAHSGGITLGPRIGDTFAVVEADDAYGAQVTNGMGASVDPFGYAIVPSLVPYRYNDVGLEGKNLNNNNIELLDNNLRVAPYSGASVKLHFRTKTGYPILISISKSTQLPLGADVFDENNNIIGMVGQGNQIYARVVKLAGKMVIPSSTNKCVIKYDIPKEKEHLEIISMLGECS